MTEEKTQVRSVVERDIAYPPEKVWRALTQPHLIEEWLMKSDFQPVVGHGFSFRADWGSVDCEVLEIEPERTLSYIWAAHGLESVVTWTLNAHRQGHAFAHGAGRFPSGSGKGLSGRQVWLAEISRQAGRGSGGLSGAGYMRD